MCYLRLGVLITGGDVRGHDKEEGWKRETGTLAC